MCMCNAHTHTDNSEGWICQELYSVIFVLVIWMVWGLKLHCTDCDVCECNVWSAALLNTHIRAAHGVWMNREALYCILSALQGGGDGCIAGFCLEVHDVSRWASWPPRPRGRHPFHLRRTLNAHRPFFVHSKYRYRYKYSGSGVASHFTLIHSTLDLRLSNVILVRKHFTPKMI